MARAKLTKRFLDGIPKPEKMVTYWDESLAGFGVLVLPSGRQTFIVNYRTGGRGSKQRRRKVGAHGPMTLDQARRCAKQMLAEVAAGNDPAQKDAGETMTVAYLADYWWREHVCDLKIGAEYISRIRRRILPKLGRMKIDDVERHHIRQIHREMADEPSGANGTLRTVRSMFNFAISEGLRSESRGNPATRIRLYDETARTRYLDPDHNEPHRFASALAELEAENRLTPWQAGALRLMLFTGMRKNEVLKLRWADVDMVSRVIRLPDAKTGPRDVELSAPAMEMLDDLPRVAGNEHVFIGHKHGGHVVNLSKPWKRICERAGLDDLRIHDLRHTSGTFAAMRGFDVMLIAKLLGHKDPRSSQRYIHIVKQAQKAATEEVGESIAAAMKGESAEIVRLKR